MNEVTKEAWVEALRSGEYEQAQGFLRLKDADGKIGHCCLGVACDLADPEAWVPDGNVYEFVVEGEGEDYHARLFLPRELRESLGMKPEQEHKLTELNDGGRTFAEIADWIEENL